MATILVVEDEMLIRLHVADYLRDCGFDVLEAADGARALEILQSGRPVDAEPRPGGEGFGDRAGDRPDVCDADGRKVGLQGGSRSIYDQLLSGDLNPADQLNGDVLSRLADGSFMNDVIA